MPLETDHHHLTGQQCRIDTLCGFSRREISSPRPPPRYRRTCRWRQLSQSTACELLNTKPVARSVKMTRFAQEKRALGTIRLSNSRKYAAAAIAWVA